MVEKVARDPVVQEELRALEAARDQTVVSVRAKARMRQIRDEAAEMMIEAGVVDTNRPLSEVRALRFPAVQRCTLVTTGVAES